MSDPLKFLKVGRGLDIRSPAGRITVKMRRRGDYVVSKSWCDYEFSSKNKARAFVRRLLKKGVARKSDRCKRRSRPV